MELEKMNDFFAKRIDGYETQMLENVEGVQRSIYKTCLAYSKQLQKTIRFRLWNRNGTS